jgi:tetratricopeptide (TPR) repeat protein
MTKMPFEEPDEVEAEITPESAPPIPEEPEELASEAFLPADVDPVGELMGQSRWRNPGIILGAVVLLLALVALLRVMAPGLFGQAPATGPEAQATLYLAPSPTAPAEAAALVSPLPGASPSPEDRQARLEQAEAMVHRSDFEEGIALYQALVAEAPEDARPEIGWARALLLDGAADQALSHALRAVELRPIDAEAMALLARAYAETGDLSHAQGMAENAVQLDPTRSDAHAALAEVYWRQDNVQEAVSEADLALSQNPDDAEAHRIRGKLYEAVDGDLASAIRELEAAVQLYPELWIAQYELGMAQLRAQDYQPALITLKTALGLRRKAMTYTAVGEAYYGLAEYDRAQAFLQQALSAGALDANTYALLAAIDARMARCDDANVFIDQALGQDSTNDLALQARDVCQGTGTVASLPATAPLPSPKPAVTSAVEPPPVGATPTPPAGTAAAGGLAPLTGWIAFAAWNSLSGDYDTYVARPDGSERHLVAEEVHQPALSPDGQWLAVNGERAEFLNLSLVRPDGSDLREVTQYIEDGLPCWSPDGERLAFSSTRHSDRQSRIYIVDQVPVDGQRADGRTLVAGATEVFGQYPAWTGNDQIVYSGCDYGNTPVECGLFEIPADPGPQTLRLLTTQPEDTAPAASNGHVAFMSSRDGNWEIYIVESDGSQLRRLTENSVNDGLPTWSPDGRTLAFVSDEGGTWAVWAMGPDGSNRRRLFELGDGGLAFDWQHERISWGP